MKMKIKLMIAKIVDLEFEMSSCCKEKEEKVSKDENKQINPPANTNNK